MIKRRATLDLRGVPPNHIVNIAFRELSKLNPGEGIAIILDDFTAYSWLSILAETLSLGMRLIRREGTIIKVLFFKHAFNTVEEEVRENIETIHFEGPEHQLRRKLSVQTLLSMNFLRFDIDLASIVVNTGRCIHYREHMSISKAIDRFLNEYEWNLMYVRIKDDRGCTLKLLVDKRSNAVYSSYECLDGIYTGREGFTEALLREVREALCCYYK